MKSIAQDFTFYAVHQQGLSNLVVTDYIDQVSWDVFALTPNIIEERSMNVAIMDVFSRLMHDRIIYLGMPVDDEVANIVVAQLLYLESADAGRDIQVYLNSPGGSVYAGMGIYDVMQYIKPEVATVCTGMAASMAAVLLCAGAKGKRAALPHARVMLHQPMSQAQGQATDIEIMAEQVIRIKQELYEVVAYHTGQPYEKVRKDSDRDFWMRADEAKAYGMIDEVLKYSRANNPLPRNVQA